MLHSGKKFTLCTTKKINILTFVLSGKKNSERNKKPYPPPPFKLNGRSLNADFNQNVFLMKYFLFSIYFTVLTTSRHHRHVQINLEAFKKLSLT